VLAVVPFLSTYVALVTYLVITGLYDAVGVRSVPAYLSLIIVAFVACRASTALVLAIARRVPMRPRRRRTLIVRERPYEVYVFLVGLGSVVLPPIAYFLGYSWSTIAQIIVMSGALLTWALRGMNRQNAIAESQKALEQSKLQVLYLRPFEAEEVVFARLPRRGLWRWVPFPDRSTAETGDANGGYQTFETFMKEPLSAVGAVLVALGSPYDDLPQAHGAVRLYAEDAEWQQMFAQLSELCLCVAGTANVSANVSWELRHLLERGFADKVFLCTSPASEDKLDDLYLRGWGLLFGVDARELWGLGPRRWDEVADMLRANGYEPPPSDPGSGAVITFTRAGVGQVILNGATVASQYVAAIGDCLATNLGVASTDSVQPREAV
jgi:hypothetical protein